MTNDKLNRQLEVAISALGIYAEAFNWHRLEGDPGKRYGETMYGFLGGLKTAESALEEIFKIRYEKESQ